MTKASCMQENLETQVNECVRLNMDAGLVHINVVSLGDKYYLIRSVVF